MRTRLAPAKKEAPCLRSGAEGDWDEVIVKVSCRQPAGGLGRAALGGRAEILRDRIDSAAPIKIRDFAGGQAERIQCIGRSAAITEEAGAGLAGDALGVLPLNGIDVIGGRNVSHLGALHRDTGLLRRVDKRAIHTR